MPDIVTLETQKQFAAKCLELGRYNQDSSLDNLLAACQRKGFVPETVYKFRSRAGFDWYMAGVA